MPTAFSVSLAVDLEDMPAPPPGAVPWLIGGLVLTWLALRVWVLRGRLAHRGPDEPAPPAPRWLLALARSPATLPVLLLAIAGCAFAISRSL